jgi:hypothetical protein
MEAFPEKKHVKIRNGTGIPTGLQCWIAKKVMTVFGNNETRTASKRRPKHGRGLRGRRRRFGASHGIKKRNTIKREGNSD